MLKEKRKAIEIGGHSISVTIPKVWCNMNNINKGDLLNVVATDEAYIVFKDSKEASAFHALSKRREIDG